MNMISFVVTKLLRIEYSHISKFELFQQGIVESPDFEH